MTFPTYEDWTPPWEKEDKEFDADVARKLVYNLSASVDKSKGKSEEHDEQLKEYESALEKYREKEKEAERANETEVEALKRKNTELEEKAKAGTAETARENLLLKVRLDKDLTESQVKRLSGDTLEELLADADEYLKDVAPPSNEEEGNEGDDDGSGDGVLDRQPRVRETLVNTNESAGSEAKFRKHLAERAQKSLF